MKAPPTLRPASNAHMRLPADLIQTIHQTIIEPMPSDLSKLERHNLAQTRLAQLGQNLGYEAKMEVPTGYRAMKKEGRFDVVWFASEAGKSITFEIDSCWKWESIVKLARLPDGQLRLWIYYGNRLIPAEPEEPGLRMLNILRIEPEHLGFRGIRKADQQTPGFWPEALHPRFADHSARGGRPGMVM